MRGYGPKTAKVYLGHLRAFVRFFKPRHPRELSDEDIRQYLLHITDNELAAAAFAKGQAIPIYLVQAPMFIGISVISASWVFILLSLVRAISTLIIAIPEERFCLEKHGDS
jgi:hypothetical protein